MASRIKGLQEHENSGAHVIDIPLSFGAVGFNLDDSDTGVVFVWYYGFKPGKKANYPVLVVPANQDIVLFEFYREQLEYFWENAKPVKLQDLR